MVAYLAPDCCQTAAPMHHCCAALDGATIGDDWAEERGAQLDRPHRELVVERRSQRCVENSLSHQHPEPAMEPAR